MTTLWGIIFLCFGFSQKACLNFEKKSCSFDRFSNTAASFISRREKCIFAAPELDWPGPKAFVVRLAFEVFSMASSLSYVQVKVNTKECLFDKSSLPHNCHISFSSLKNRAIDSEYIFNNTRSGASIDGKYFLSSSEVSLFIFRSTCPLNLQEIFYKLKWSYLFYLRHRIV